MYRNLYREILWLTIPQQSLSLGNEVDDNQLAGKYLLCFRYCSTGCRGLKGELGVDHMCVSYTPEEKINVYGQKDDNTEVVND